MDENVLITAVHRPQRPPTIACRVLSRIPRILHVLASSLAICSSFLSSFLLPPSQHPRYCSTKLVRARRSSASSVFPPWETSRACVLERSEAGWANSQGMPEEGEKAYDAVGRFVHA
ncbi:hypothetical protein BD309DRAFT_200046 [Dichomitus squalens]|nr:hypothetical protein BD309DRAFT_200046 [Dichomitus squalens]